MDLNININNDENVLGGNELRQLPKITVAVKDCYRPSIYGRELRQLHIDRIAAIFDYKKVGEICVYKVTDEDGTVRYEIVDGNHRHQAMEKKYGYEFMFEVSLLPDNMTVEERAEEYKERNKNVAPMRPVELFKADAVMGDEQTLNIIDICDKAELKIDGYNIKSKHYPNITSIRDLNDLYEAGTLQTVLRVIRTAFDKTPSDWKKKATTSSMLRAINKFLVFYQDHKNYNEERLIKTLEKHDSTHWVADIAQHAQYSSEGVMALIVEYNYKLTEKRGLPRRSY